MADALYDKGREGFATAEIDWVDDTIKAVLVDTGAYTASMSSDQFLSDIPSGARIAISPAFTSKTATAGVCDAADITFATVSGVSVEVLVIFKDTGTASTSRLIAKIDSATGLPVTPNGGDINIVWSDGANKIFKL
ncbi:hypothetical protein B5566_02400 [Mycobacterium sp. MHSD3]|nr:hypothetical protein B5566_02400 [Mycobacterium sp. MHSD3]